MQERQPDDFEFEALEKIDVPHQSGVLDMYNFRRITFDQFNKIKEFLANQSTQINDLKKEIREQGDQIAKLNALADFKMKSKTKKG